MSTEGANMEAQNSARASYSNGRGRGRGASQGNTHNTNSTGEGSPQQNRRRGDGTGRGRGRGGSANTRGAAGHIRQVSNTTSNPVSSSMAVAQGVAALKAKEVSTAGVEKESGAEEVEAEVCFICASPVVHNSVSPCNHRTCHICALRMRALYKTKDCAHCRTPAEFVILTDNATKRFEDFKETDFVHIQLNIGIKYENPEILEDAELLLRYNCPDPSCDVACWNWPDLHRHVRSVHHKKMCDLCTKNKKVFTHEHELYTDKELEKHMRKGDDNPGAIDQSGFRGHPLCGFCGERFYGDDELYVHCRAKHERCFICDRRGGQPQYYVNYDSLEAHFKKDHFLCLERVCLDKKFTVFESEMDLKAHQLQEHGNTLSKDVRRDARVVDMASFDFRAPYVQERRGGGREREGRGRGRGRDPNSDAIPASSAQPLRRDEQAFQRQMAIQSAQSVSTRTFGGQLTQPTAASREATTTTSNRPIPRVENVTEQLNALDMASNGPETPQEQARRLRHNAVIERATALAQHDESKMASFRSTISSFRTDAISANGLIETFFTLFDTSAASLGSLIRDVADLYEDKEKAQSLQSAWNDWRAINEDYPSLPGPSASSANIPLGWAQVTASTPSSSVLAPPKSTSRVLKLKSSTAQSSRSQTSRNASWGTSSAASSNPFPSLSAPLSANRIGAGRVSTTPWVNPTPAQSNSASAPTSARHTPPTSRPASRNVGTDAFPALPPAKKPTTTIFGYGTGMVRRDAGSSAGNFTWGGGGASADEVTQSEGEAPGLKKKGNKGKKVLLQWG